MYTLCPRQLCPTFTLHLHSISQEAFILEAMLYFISSNLFKGQLYFVPMVKTRTIKCPCQGNRGASVLFYLWGKVLFLFYLENMFFAFEEIIKKTHKFVLMILLWIFNKYQACWFISLIWLKLNRCPGINLQSPKWISKENSQSNIFLNSTNIYWISTIFFNHHFQGWRGHPQNKDSLCLQAAYRVACERKTSHKLL